MLSLCLVWCTFVALGHLFSSATTIWWSPKWSLNRSLTVGIKYHSINQQYCYGRPLLQAWLLPDLNMIPNNCVGRIPFSSVVMVLAFQPGSPGSNPVRTLYFCHAFIHFFFRYKLCS